MSGRRKSFSVRPRYYRWLRYGAERHGKSGASLAELAIVRLMNILAVPEPPDDWEPTPGHGRPRKREPDRPSDYFTF